MENPQQSFRAVFLRPWYLSHSEGDNWNSGVIASICTGFKGMSTCAVGSRGKLCYSLGSGEVVFLRKLVICSLCYVFKLLNCPKFLKNALISAIAVLCSIHILLSFFCGHTPSSPES